ncbi:MAG TPA: MMPL family transporter, partial [Gammaproteobacteria bacterium]
MATNNGTVRYAKWVLNHPFIVILLSLLMVAAGASGGRFLAFTADYRVFFGKDNPELVAFESLEKMYTKNDNVMFIVTPKDGNVFTPETLKIIQALTQQGWQVPYSIRVDSIANFQHTQAQGDELTVRDLVPEDEPLDAAALDKIKTIALNEPLLKQRLISKTGHVTGVNVTVQLPGKNLSKEVPEVVAFARALAGRFMEKYPSVEIRLSGIVMMNNAFTEASQNDITSLVPISFALMLVTLALMLKGFSGTAGTLLIIIFSILVAMGTGGYLGFPISPPSASTPIIVLTVAIANAVHVLVTFLHEMRRGLEKKPAMIESLRINMQPVFIASVTTALGFLSMNFADVPPFNHLGNMVAMGVLASFVFTVFFLPAFMLLMPVRAKPNQKGNGYTMMDHVGEYVVDNRKWLMWGMFTAVIALI